MDVELTQATQQITQTQAGRHRAMRPVVGLSGPNGLRFDSVGITDFAIRETEERAEFDSSGVPTGSAAGTLVQRLFHFLDRSIHHIATDLHFRQ